MSRKGARWSQEETAYLRRHYHLLPADQISFVLQRPWKAIIAKAGTLGLERRRGCPPRNNVRRLLQDDPVTFYWIGFILADGHITADGMLSILLADQDEEHIRQFADLIGSQVNRAPKRVIVRARDKRIVPMLASKFDIAPRKTYDPPVMRNYTFETDAITALIAGFIDGDGSINRRAASHGSSAKLVVHAAWLENLKFMKEHVRRLCPGRFEQDAVLDARGRASLTLTGWELFRLKEEAARLKLPLMTRKWSKVERPKGTPPLCPEDIRAIRASPLSNSEEGRRRGLNHQVISLIRLRRTYRDVA